MSLHSTPMANRLHIALLGMRNAGKSSLINALTNQQLAVVSPIKGTTTDPVTKTMELLPLGPVVLIDTPGLDDTGSLGQLRVQKALQVLRKADIAIIVIEAGRTLSTDELTLIEKVQQLKLPYVIVHNKSDLLRLQPPLPRQHIYVSTVSRQGIEELKQLLGKLAPSSPSRTLLQDLVQAGDTVVLVIPIDTAAPKGRLILPQQQVIRELLDTGATAIMTQTANLQATLQQINTPPRLVITDSQAFKQVAAIVDKAIPLTSFSILFSRYKGDLARQVAGAKVLSSLTSEDKILIAEGCTHHRQCDDIGTVKIPRWIEQYTGCKPQLIFTSGTEFPDDLSSYKLVIHCGGCMLNEREMTYRITSSINQGIPITNYGTAIAQMHGILERSIAVFPNL